MTDSLLEEWKDIAEASFTIESETLCFDGFSGEISQPIPAPEQLGDPHLIQYRDRFIGNRVRPDDTREYAVTT